MQVIPLTAAPQGFGQTSRRDSWWATPLVVFTVFTAFIVYATWAAFQNAHYKFGPYLSPFYSPVLLSGTIPSHAWFGPQPAWWPGFRPVLAGAADPSVPRPLSFHVLLLPGRLLQGVLGRSAELRGRRTAQGLPGRELVPADPAEHPPLLLLHRGDLHLHPVLRRVAGAVVHEPGDCGRSSASAWAPSCCSINVMLLASYTFGCHSGRHVLRRPRG